MPPLSPESPPEPQEPPEPQVLLRAGRITYEFVRRLGLARHGEWVLARRRYDEGFGGYSLLKRPRTPVSEEALRRLVDEALVTSQLHHPNIPTMQLQGTPELPYLVLEHLPGHRLEKLLERSVRMHFPLSEGFACHLIVEVADALHHAHTLLDEHGRALGIVHRDVTPYNILLGEHGEVKLVDFGAAWSRLEGRVRTEGPQLQGSLAYAAPEQVQHLPLDAGADQFSLGIILLQLLTGRHLFEGAERFDAQQRRRHLAHTAATRQCARELTGRIRGYSHSDLEAATRMVPEALRPIVHRMLAPQRANRFASCAQVSRVLREHLGASGQYGGRHLVLAELIGLSYFTLRLNSGASPSDLDKERMLSEPAGPLSAPGPLLSRRALRPRPPRRR